MKHYGSRRETGRSNPTDAPRIECVRSPETVTLLDQVRSAFHLMTLNEALAADAVRRPYYRAGTALEMLHHPSAAALEVCREVQFGDCSLSLVGP